MRFANPGLLGTVNRFNERFAGPIERNRDREAQHVLKRLIGPFVLRRTKAEVLQELPPRTELILTVAPEAAEAAHYEALRREGARAIDATLESARSAGALQHPRATDAPAPRRLRPAPVQPGIRHRRRQGAGLCRTGRRTDRQRPQGAGVQPVRRLPASPARAARRGGSATSTSTAPRRPPNAAAASPPSRPATATSS
jgi:hypothetical protein